MLFENYLIKAVQFVGRSNVANGAVQPEGVVVLDVLTIMSLVMQ